jgi:DNA-binding Lrp family transcriptional regulator
MERRQLGILEALEAGDRLSQRELAHRLGMSVGFLNRCMNDLIARGYVSVMDRNVRPFAYKVTTVGEQYRQRLTSDHYRAVVAGFMELERRVEARLHELKVTGAQCVVFYGAGEIMEVAHKCAATVGLQVVGAIDDDTAKHGAARNGLKIHAPSAIDELQPDAVLITTFRHAKAIAGRVRTRPGLSVWHL